MTEKLNSRGRESDEDKSKDNVAENSLKEVSMIHSEISTAGLHLSTKGADSKQS